MGFADRIRRLFSSRGPDDQAALREEYGEADRGEAELERDRFVRAGDETLAAAETELDEFKAPPDPSP